MSGKGENSIHPGNILEDCPQEAIARAIMRPSCSASISPNVPVALLQSFLARADSWRFPLFAPSSVRAQVIGWRWLQFQARRLGGFDANVAMAPVCRHRAREG